MSKIIEDKAQDFAGINEDKAANYAFCYNKYDIADAYEHGADFGYALAANRIKKEYEEKLRWIPVHEKMPEQLTYIELKDSCDRIFSGSLSMQNEFRDRLHNDRLHFIVSWRSFL